MDNLEEVKKILQKKALGRKITAKEMATLKAYKNAQEKEPGGKTGLGVAESLTAAASMSGYTLEVLKRAKKEGCQAFRGNRVHLDELDAFIVANPAMLNMTPPDRLDFETKQIKKAAAQFDFDLKRGDYIERGELAEHVRTTETASKAVLRKFLLNELPAKGEMLGRAALVELCEDIFDRICVEKQKAFSKWI